MLPSGWIHTIDMFELNCISTIVGKVKFYQNSAVTSLNPFRISTISLPPEQNPLETKTPSIYHYLTWITAKTFQISRKFEDAATVFQSHIRLTMQKSWQSSCEQGSNYEENITSNICIHLRSCAQYNVYTMWLYVCLKHIYDYFIHRGVEISYNDFILYVNDIKYYLI